MKCVYCGGEVAAEALSCPYCGKENEEGIHFQQEIQAKIKRNKLLAPILLKQKTPELVERLLNRMIFAGIGLFVACIAVAFICFITEYGLGVWNNNRSPHSEYAQSLEEAHDAGYSCGYNYWIDNKNQMLDALETGELISDYEAQYLFESALRIRSEEDETDPYVRKGKEEVEAFFRGILRFDDAEMEYLDLYEEYYDLEEERQKEIHDLIWQRLLEVQRKWEF